MRLRSVAAIGYVFHGNDLVLSALGCLDGIPL
jgi:hypothetical protein